MLIGIERKQLTQPQLLRTGRKPDKTHFRPCPPHTTSSAHETPIGRSQTPFSDRGMALKQASGASSSDLPKCITLLRIHPTSQKEAPDACLRAIFHDPKRESQSALLLTNNRIRGTRPYRTKKRPLAIYEWTDSKRGSRTRVIQPRLLQTLGTSHRPKRKTKHKHKHNL